MALHAGLVGHIVTLGGGLLQPPHSGHLEVISTESGRSIIGLVGIRVSCDHPRHLTVFEGSLPTVSTPVSRTERQQSVGSAVGKDEAALTRIGTHRDARSADRAGNCAQPGDPRRKRLSRP